MFYNTRNRLQKALCQFRSLVAVFSSSNEIIDRQRICVKCVLKHKVKWRPGVDESVRKWDWRNPQLRTVKSCVILVRHVYRPRRNAIWRSELIGSVRLANRSHYRARVGENSCRLHSLYGEAAITERRIYYSWVFDPEEELKGC